MNTIPGATALSARAFNSIAPRRVVTRIRSPARIPSRRNSAGARLAIASGSISSSTVPRLVLGVARIGHRALALQPLPGDVVERGHRQLHLGENIGRAGVAPVEPHATADLLDLPPIKPSVAGQRQRGTAHLHLAIGIG